MDFCSFSNGPTQQPAFSVSSSSPCYPNNEFHRPHCVLCMKDHSFYYYFNIFGCYPGRQNQMIVAVNNWQGNMDGYSLNNYYFKWKEGGSYNSWWKKKVLVQNSNNLLWGALSWKRQFYRTSISLTSNYLLSLRWRCSLWEEDFRKDSFGNWWRVGCVFTKGALMYLRLYSSIWLDRTPGRPDLGLARPQPAIISNPWGNGTDDFFP